MSENRIIAAVKQKDAILFDLFHTLTKVESSWSAGPMSCEMLGVSKEAWNEQLLEKSRERLTGEVKDPFAIIRKMAHALNPDIPEDVVKRTTENRMKRFYNALVNVPDETIRTLRKLKSMNKKIGLVSNADVSEITGWEKSPAAEFFDSVIFSCDVGCVKPEPEIYTICMEELGVKAEQCLFVGDGGSHELEGAGNLGITTVMITRVIREIWPDRIDARKLYADYVIERLSELVM